MIKKLYFLMAIVVSVGCLCGLSACGDDDEPSSKSCTCQEYDADTNIYTGSSNLDPGSFNQSSCSALANHLNQFTTDTYITCE